MGIFNFGKKNKKEVKNSKNLGYVKIDDQHFIQILNPQVYKTLQGTDLYTMEVYETHNIDDAMLLDYTSPIAFELPMQRSDLVESLIKLWNSQRGTTNLSQVSYTYIGNIKRANDGNLYYYNEPPTNEVSNIINSLERNFQSKRKQRWEYAEQQAKINKEKIDKPWEISDSVKKQIEMNQRIKRERLQNPYFKYTSDISGREGYDAINLSSGSIMLIRQVKKYKDSSGRYLYTAYIRDTNEDTYTEYATPIGYQVAFTAPGRLADIVQNMDNKSQTYKNSIQKMLSIKFQELEKNNNTRGLIDIGGVDFDGKIIENTEKDGVSLALIEQIHRLGGRKLEEIEQSK